MARRVPDEDEEQPRRVVRAHRSDQGCCQACATQEVANAIRDLTTFLADIVQEMREEQ